MTEEFYQFPCGCKIPIIDGHPQIDYENLNLECPETWKVYKNGYTQSVFQLEKYLGKHYSRELKPDNIDHAAALIAIIRPGVLNAEDEHGNILTKVFCNRKNSNWRPSENIVDKTFSETFGICTYQEDIMSASRKLAGFDGVKSVALIKGIAKKSQEIVNKFKEEFFEGVRAQKTLTDEETETLWAQIESSGRYAFNRCLCPNTTFLETNRGKLLLKDVKIGDYVKSPDGDSEITAIFDNGEQLLYKVELVSGESIICTATHKFPTNLGMITVNDMIFSSNMIVELQTLKGYSQLLSVTPIGLGPTIDITVNNISHTYYGNGIATSNSHSYGYALTGYQTAWVKAHLPKHYICAWLRISKKEQKPLEEIRAVISEARRLKINVFPPSIRTLPYTDFFIKNDNVYFGLDSIKNCSAKSFEKVPDIDYENCYWLEFLVEYSKYLDKRKMQSMIRCGCFDLFNTDRLRMEYEYDLWQNLTPTNRAELTKIFHKSTPSSLLDCVKEFTKDNEKKRTTEKIYHLEHCLENPLFNLVDSKDNIVAHEKELMGINVSCSKISKAEVPAAPNKCKDVSSDKFGQNTAIILGELCELNEFKIKNGKLAGQYMASFKVIDDSGECECVIFPEALDSYQAAMYDGNIVLIVGKKSNRGSLICNEIFEV